ncbi:unnamed protein product [Effrenium voratum]|nr:unnamed protein product [Effrenium voratum]
MDRKRRSEENILGIFAEGEFEGTRKRRQDKARDKANAAPNLTAPMSFVRGQTLAPTSIPAPKEVKDDKDDKDGKDDDSDEVDSRFVLDASLPNGNFQPAVAGPKLPARNKLSFGQMADNYGKGFAMLQKMGFTGGGLGRHRDGIANPIAVQKRQGKQGIQDDGEMVDQEGACGGEEGDLSRPPRGARPPPPRRGGRGCVVVYIYMYS